MSSDSPLSSLLDTAKKTTETVAELIRWLAELIQRRNWFMLLVFVGVGLSLAGKFLQDWINQQFDEFPWGLFWLTVSLIFMTALGVAVVTMPRATDAEPVDLTERKAIKGLRPFRREDAEIFSRLQRNRSLQDCLEAITSPTFRFGILMGESGCGKTSFLQAGLWPTLTQADTSHYGIYVRFSDQEPTATICQGLIEQLQLPETTAELDFLDLLSTAVNSVEKPLILLFDQFEQFFVHTKHKAERVPFIDLLKAWYHQSDLPVKILVCIRGDLCDRLIELHQALGYALGPREVFRLEKFSPEEATEVLAVIAETEELPFDKRFIAELTQQELASREDGLILPVDLQVLAWTVNRQNMSELRAFNRLAFQKIGGIEGLLTRFLERTLDARVIPSQRQAAVKVLLALTDLDRQVRAGVLTIVALQTKLKDSLQPEAVAEATTWLARPDVRLITPVNSGETGGYELSHERLIPALTRLAGKELSEADRVNQLLDRRVNEWLGNQRSQRYLFNWQELRLIQRHKPFLIWGGKRQQKEQLIIQSQRNVYGKITAVLAISLSILLGCLWLSSPTGIIWQTRRELVQLSGRVPDHTAEEAAKALAKDEQFKKAFKIGEQDIQNSYLKASALSSIAKAYSQLDDNAEAVKLLSQALTTAEKINNLYDKARVLNKIAEAISQLDDNTEAEKLLSQALITAEKIDDLSDKAWALGSIAKAYIQLGDNTEVEKLLSQAVATAEKIDVPPAKAWALGNIAEAIGQLDDNTEAEKLLSQALITAEKIDNLSNKAQALSAVHLASAQLNPTDERSQHLKQALIEAQKIDNSNNKAKALIAIAETQAKFGNWRKAHHAVSFCTSNDCRVQSRAKILTVWAEQ